MSLAFRHGEASDLPFIISSWVKSARKGERHVFMTNDDYFKFYRNKVIRLLSTSFVRVIYDTVAPEVIIGYAVYTLTPEDYLVLHYVYIKKLLWNQGYARKLIADIYPDYKSKPVITTSLALFQTGYDKYNDKNEAIGHRVGLTDRYPLLSYNPYFDELEKS